MRRLFVGTSNKGKYKRIEMIMRYVNPEIEVIIATKTRPIVQEKGSLLERAKDKSLVYRERPIVTTDEGFLVIEDSQNGLNLDIKGGKLKQKEIFEMWKKRVTVKNIKGELSQVYFVNNGEKNSFVKIRIPVILKNPIHEYVSGNALSYLMYSNISSNVPVKSYSRDQQEEFYKDFYVIPIARLIRKAGI